MFFRNFTISMIITFMLLDTWQVSGDGCFLGSKGADLEEPSQKAVIYFQKGRETLLLQVKYEGTAKDFAWIVPLPSKPEIKAIKTEDSPFSELSYYTQVRVPRDPTSYFLYDDYSVKIIERKSVGVFDITVLNASNPETLAVWLRKNGYSLPDNIFPILNHYVKKKWIYIAMRINLDKITEEIEKKLNKGTLQPIRFIFKTPKAVYPLRISSINEGKTDVLLYALAGIPLQISDTLNKNGLSIDNNIPIFLKFPMLVKTAFQDTTYGTYRKYDIEKLPKTWAALNIDKKSELYLCKYRGVFKPKEMTGDLFFAPFEPLKYFDTKLGNTDDLSSQWRLVSFLVKKNKNKYSKLQLRLLEQMSKSKDLELCLIAARNVLTPKDCFKNCLNRGQFMDYVLVDNPQTPPEILFELAKGDGLSYVSAKALQHKNMDAIHLKKLSKETSVVILTAVARNHKTPVDILRNLLNNKKSSVHCAAALNPSLPMEDFTGLVKRKEAILLEKIASSPRTTGKMLAELLGQKMVTTTIREIIVRHPKLMDETLFKLASDRNESIRASLAKREKLPIELINILAEDKSYYVRAGIAGNSKSPLSVLEKLLHDKSELVRQSLASNSKLSNKMALKLVKDTYSVRRQLAKHVSLPIHILDILSTDSEWNVRYAVAENIKTPEKILSKLCRDDSTSVQGAVARNLNTSSVDLNTLSEHKSFFIREYVAGNKNVPIGILEKLSNDKLKLVRGQVACNPKLTLEIAVKLSRDDEYVRKHLATNDSLPVQLFFILAEDESTWVKVALAGNIKTPPEILSKLSKIDNEYIEEALAQNINTPLNVLNTFIDGYSYSLSRFAKKTLESQFQND